jgi:hypothetical protein
LSDEYNIDDPYVREAFNNSAPRTVKGMMYKARLKAVYDRTTSEMRGSVFQDPDRVILDEARMHANTHTKHSKHNFIENLIITL